MLCFPEEFFLKETREGFTIDSTMKSCWAAELEVLREIAEVCERHNLQWYAAYGTLLGTIRHEGFVPWDDDMDIWMKREDYNEFVRVAPKELPQEFVVQSPVGEYMFTEFHTCVVNALTISSFPDRLQRFHGCPFAVGVDVFPLDYLPDNDEEREGQEAIFLLIDLAIGLIKKKERTEEERADLQEAFDTIEEICGVTLKREKLDTDEDVELLSSVYKLANQLCACYGEEDGSYLVMYVDYDKWPQKIYKKEWFDEILQKPFEGFWMPVPVGYDDILKRIYGDYHVRARSGGMHNYPFYKKQVEHLREVTERLEGKAERIEELVAQARREDMAEQEGQ